VNRESHDYVFQFRPGRESIVSQSGDLKRLGFLFVDGEVVKWGIHDSHVQELSGQQDPNLIEAERSHERGLNGHDIFKRGRHFLNTAAGRKHYDRGEQTNGKRRMATRSHSVP